VVALLDLSFAGSCTPIKRHVKVKHTASPYDGNLIYWAQRLKDHPLTGTRTGILLKVQHGLLGGTERKVGIRR
jgi:hypothetical protein